MVTGIFKLQVLGLRLTQMTLQRGWNNKSKLLAVSFDSYTFLFLGAEMKCITIWR